MSVPRFEAEPHTYWRGDRRLESVTEVLHGVGFLPDYSRLDPYYRERGSAVHLALQLDFAGDLDDESLDEHVAPFVLRARNFVEAINFRPLWCEGPLACDTYDYAGTPDVLGDSDLGLVLPDWKAGQFEPGHKLQVAGGYLPLLECAAADGLLTGLTVADVAAAKCCVVPLTTDLPAPVWVEDETDWRDLFRSALAVYRWRSANVRARNANP